jgi:MtN3 and saliva related transmembrane protein
MEISPVELLGLLAGFLTAFSSIPQIVKIIRLKDSRAVSVVTFSMLVGSYGLWLAYGVIQGAISIVFWNVIALVLGGIVLFLKIFVWK